jgi:predicted Zn finger-like uncharacterized protein
VIDYLKINKTMKVQIDNSQLEPTNDVVKCHRCKKRYDVVVFLDLKNQSTKCEGCLHVQTYNRKGLEKSIVD